MSLIAVMTGLVFSRFSRPKARFVFAKRPVIGQHDGRPTLMLRLANARQNRISGATARLWLLTTERTIENRPYRRFRELKLIRNENPTFALSWTIFHVVESQSPLWGATPASLQAVDAGLLLTVSGIDEQLVQELHGRNSYTYADIAWGEHFVDILSVDEDGRTRIDYGRLDGTEPDAQVSG
jgi:inward rectifier potassium channel